MTYIKHDNDNRWKQINREFESMSTMFEAIFYLSKKEDLHKLRIPLSCLLEYKGFRCLAIAVIPISPDYPPALGFDQDGKFITDRNIMKILSNIG